MAPKPRTQPPSRRRAELAEYYRELLAEQEESGLSVAEFAEEVGLSGATLYAWRRKLSLDIEGGNRPTGQLVEVSVACSKEAVQRSSSLILRVGDEFEVELDEDFDAGALRRLLEVLGAC